MLREPGLNTSVGKARGKRLGTAEEVIGHAMKSAIAQKVSISSRCLRCKLCCENQGLRKTGSWMARLFIDAQTSEC